MRPSTHRTAKTALLSAAAALFAAAAAAPTARAVVIANHSFEDESSLPAGFSTSVQGWAKEGLETSTGIFFNGPDGDFGGVPSKNVGGADGAQLGFMAAQNPGAGNSPAIFQSLGDVYQAGVGYTLTVGVATSSVQPPTTPAGGPEARIRFALTYTDGTGRHEIAGRSVRPSDLVDLPNDVELFDDGVADDLNYFSVSLAGSAVPPASYVGRNIGVLITTAENTAAYGGNFGVDNVSVAATVPEPAGATAALVALALAGLRRRPRRGQARR